jgi:hypothetical protein
MRIATAVVAPPESPVPLWFAPRADIEIPPFTTKLPVTYTTVNNLRTGGRIVWPALMVRLPLTTIHDDVVSLVFVNQSDAVNDEMVVFALRAVTS